MLKTILINAKEVNILEKGKIIEAIGSVEIIDGNIEIKINGDKANIIKKSIYRNKRKRLFFDKLRNINVKR